MRRAERRAASAAGNGRANRPASAEEHLAGKRVLTEQPRLDADALHADARPDFVHGHRRERDVTTLDAGT